MRFGLNTFLVSPGFSDSDLHLIETFRDFGAEAIELAIVEPGSVSGDRLKSELSRVGFERPLICGAFGGGRDLRGSQKQVAETVLYMHELMDLAVTLGSRVVCGPFFSETGRTGQHSLSERELQMKQIATELRPICKRAEDEGLILAVEPLNRFETDCINTIDQAIALIERVGSSSLKIHIDTFHMNIEEENSPASILRAGSHIGHVHASASHRGLLGHDHVDWDGVLAALHEINYEGDVIIESFSEDNLTIARAASIWRKLYESPEQLAVEGLQFLRDTVRKNYTETAMS